MAYERESKEAIALKSLQSKRYPDSNKDFVKNMRRLNSSVDYISSYMQKMQKGIDDANKNFIEQIQSFINDLIVLFAGGEPTGFDFGDLKYVIQGLGALFGLNGPFPLSLIEAAQHFFLGYVVPLPQFTDVIFDTIFAWAEELGLDEEFIENLHELAEAFNGLAENVQELLENMGSLLDVFGITGGDFGPLGALWDAIFSMFDGVDTSGFSNLLDLVTGVMNPFIVALTEIVEAVNTIIEAFSGGATDIQGIANFASIFNSIDFTDGDFNPVQAAVSIANLLIPGLLSGGLLNFESPLNAFNIFNLIDPGNIPIIGTGQIANIQSNLLTDPGFNDSASLAGSVAVHDIGVGHSNPLGSARVAADGTAKDLLSNYVRCAKGDRLAYSVWVRKQGLTGTGTLARLGITTYSYSATTDEYTAVEQIDSASVTSGSSDFVKISGTYEITSDSVDGVKLRLAVTSAATAGNVWWDDASLAKTGFILTSLIADQNGNGLPDILDNVFGDLSDHATQLLQAASQGDLQGVIAAIGGSFGANLTAIQNRLNQMLTPSSSLPSGNLVGNIASGIIPGLLDTWDNLVKNIRNIDGSGFGQTDLAAAIQAQTDAITGIGAQVAQLQTIYTSGVSDGDDFERVGSNPGAGWLLSYTSGAGTVGTPNGHDLTWQNSGTGDRDFLMIRNTGQVRSASDLQRVLIAFGSKPGYIDLGILGGIFCGFNDVWLRITDDTTSIANVTGIRIRIGGHGGASITRFNSGTATAVLNSLPVGSLVVPGPGATFGGEAGKPGTGRYFKLILNGNGVLDIPEVGTASAIGSTARRWGLGGRVEGHLLPLPTQEKIGAVRQWVGMDQ